MAMITIMKRTNILYFLSVLIFLVVNLYLTGFVFAQSVNNIAVLPIQDLTHGANGVNFNCTNMLEEDLSKHGIETVSNQQIMSFLVRHRIRWTGYIDSYDAFLLGKELKTDYVLLGTICQYNNKIDPRVGLTLILLNTKTASNVWAWVGSLSIKDFIHPLGLFEPKNVASLLPFLINKAVKSFPKNIELKGRILPCCTIKNVIIRPRFVRPSDSVTCIVRVNHLNGKINPIIKLYLNNRYITLKHLYGNEYKIIFNAPIKQGCFPVYLIYQLNNRLHKLYAGNVVVDSKAPKVRLIARGIHIWNAIALKKRLIILPRLTNPEPISRWQIAVCTLDGSKILSQDGPGPLPSKFFWRGQDASGAMVATGVYKIVLNIWDMAGNKAQASIRVAVIRTPPKIKVSSKFIDNKLFLTVTNDTDIPLSFWRLEIFEGNNLLYTDIGSKLPETINLFIPNNKSTRLSCIVTARDIFGNITKKKFATTIVIQHGKKASKKRVNNNWTPTF